MNLINKIPQFLLEYAVQFLLLYCNFQKYESRSNAIYFFIPISFIV